MESMISYVAPKDVTNPENAKTRYISDPRNEANDRIDNDRRAQYISFLDTKNVARRVIYWKRRYPSIPILIRKRIEISAFKLTPLRPRASRIWASGSPSKLMRLRRKRVFPTGYAISAIISYTLARVLTKSITKL